MQKLNMYEMREKYNRSILGKLATNVKLHLLKDIFIKISMQYFVFKTNTYGGDRIGQNS